MRILYVAGAVILPLVLAAHAAGHGFPIQVGAAAGRVTVANGLALSGGYATAAFDRSGGSGEDGFELGLFTTLPGFERTTLPATMPLTLEVLGRPDHSAAARPTRWLWHASGTPAAVDGLSAGASMSLVEVFGSETIQFTPLGPQADTTIAVTAAAGEHHLLLYQLNESAPEPGVYAFFARLTAPELLPSEPFLIGFAFGVGEAQFAAGLTAINAAAGLAGDYDVDGDVDGADFVRWQRSLGTTAAGPNYAPADGSLDGVVGAEDLAVWRSQHGRKIADPPPASPAGAAPEPSTLAMVALAGLGLAPRLHRGRRPGVASRRVKTGSRG